VFSDAACMYFINLIGELSFPADVSPLRLFSLFVTFTGLRENSKSFFAVSWHEFKDEF
jgi:hypothetical protein